ncbi:hypothetical protein BWQ96_01740 [Gracilariopsis chorda]|uniref:Transmembrane protein 208-like n=1 Tax=Gracilariopsis chorda TaxID=448386 RepID=A0A2V3J292_9FLOR|nr:hypothetical protein BWQ96_01740 [Gracilariopsis chorda]|eukprot:PXF48571.1 hypothetical protein BWQ96_01740 [Gracilariopsis chorda]
MANSSAKKLYKANAKRLSLLRTAIIFSNLLHVLPFVIKRSIPRFHQIVFPILLMVYALPYMFLRSAAQPTFDAYGSIVDAGSDISGAGLLEYCHDLLFLTMVVQVGMLFTKWMLLVFLVVPVFTVYKMCASPFSSSGTQGEEEELDEYAFMSRKERRKADRKAKRQR